MSQHPSFSAGGSGSKKKRNVLKRFERIALLRKRGDWDAEKGVFGLKKTLPDE
jgi:small basic protein (TIGR04137 family)|tara:strand:- start:1743 stop:1901 length:159 start_codon:yes stop_codon:yes gene_type:complete